MPETPSTRRWRALVQAHAASGLSNADFAKAHGLNPSTLSWWRSRLKRPVAEIRAASQRPAFTELVVADCADTVVLNLDRISARVVILHDTDLALLKRVLMALS